MSIYAILLLLGLTQSIHDIICRVKENIALRTESQRLGELQVIFVITCRDSCSNKQPYQSHVTGVRLV